VARVIPPIPITGIASVFVLIVQVAWASVESVVGGRLERRSGRRVHGDALAAKE
jgi:hypothetical protein